MAAIYLDAVQGWTARRRKNLRRARNLQAISARSCSSAAQQGARFRWRGRRLEVGAAGAVAGTCRVASRSTAPWKRLATTTTSSFRVEVYCYAKTCWPRVRAPARNRRSRPPRVYRAYDRLSPRSRPPWIPACMIQRVADCDLSGGRAGTAAGGNGGTGVRIAGAADCFVGLFVITFLLQPSQIPYRFSMEPTMLVGDFVSGQQAGVRTGGKLALAAALPRTPRVTTSSSSTTRSIRVNCW